MHKFGFRDAKVNVTGSGLAPHGSNGFPEDSDVRTVGERRRCEAEIVDIGEGDSLREVNVQ